MSKEVFFLGAGFSKYLDSGYPSLANLTEKFMPPNKDLGDIEQYLTYLVSKLPFKDEATIYENLAEYKRLTKKIADYFWELEDKVTLNLSNKQKEIFQIILDKKIPCITMNYDLLLEKILLQNSKPSITMNYDLLLEKILLQNSKPKLEYEISDFYNTIINFIVKITNSENLNYRQTSNVSINGLQIPLYKEIANKLEILKLHGSINWYYNGVSSNDTIYLYEKTNNENVNKFRDNLSNFIIPPTLDKQSLYNHIAITHLWKQAYKYLANAEKIYIFGYSFPISDISTEYLFRTALTRNNKCKIYVFGGSEEKENIKDGQEKKISRYRQIFGDKYEYSYGNDENTKRLLEILNNK